MKLATAKEIIKKTFEQNLKLEEGASDAEYLIPMMWSLPGTGKSETTETIAREMGAIHIRVIMAQFDAGELGGFPMVENGGYKRARPFFLPDENCEKLYVLDLDELPQAPTACQNVAAQIVNERRIGEHKLPKNTVIVCAGNPMSARAGTNVMPSHLKDRLMHLTIDIDHEGFREYALAKGVSPEITGYINERPEWLSKFDPAVNASPSPRSWVRADSILKMKLDSVAERQALEGMIGDGATADFCGYLRIWRDLPKVSDIVANPTGHSIPEDPSILYALGSSIAHKANGSNIKAIITYIDRFVNKEFAAFAMRDAMKRHPDLMKNKEMTNWLMTTGKELML